MTENSLTTPDGSTLYTINWQPAGTPRAIVLLVHGIGEHSRRYDHVAQALTAAGYAVYALDHRGHGRSSGARVNFKSFDEPVADLKLYFDTIRAQHPYLKIFLYGHSMGSLISTLFLLRYQELVSGFISSGSPLLIDTSVPAPVLAILRGLARLAPQLALLPVDSSTVSRDPAVVAAYDADPLVYHKRTQLGMLNKLVEAAIRARKLVHTLRLPLLVLHGAADPLTPLAGSQHLYDHADSADKTLKIIPNAFHEIHNEPEQNEVFAEMVAWLNARS